MDTDLEFIESNHKGNGSVTVECPIVKCDGILYYPDMSPGRVGEAGDTMRAMVRCAHCDYRKRVVVSPQNLTIRVVVQK
jgi:C4-type Zn-finger protein